MLQPVAGDDGDHEVAFPDRPVTAKAPGGGQGESVARILRFSQIDGLGTDIRSPPRLTRRKKGVETSTLTTADVENPASSKTSPLQVLQTRVSAYLGTSFFGDLVIVESH